MKPVIIPVGRCEGKNEDPRDQGLKVSSRSPSKEERAKSS